MNKIAFLFAFGIVFLEINVFAAEFPIPDDEQHNQEQQLPSFDTIFSHHEFNKNENNKRKRELELHKDKGLPHKRARIENQSDEAHPNLYPYSFDHPVYPAQIVYPAKIALPAAPVHLPAPHRYNQHNQLPINYNIPPCLSLRDLLVPNQYSVVRIKSYMHLTPDEFKKEEYRLMQRQKHKEYRERKKILKAKQAAGLLPVHGDNTPN